MLSLILLFACTEKGEDTAELTEEITEETESSFDCSQDYAMCSTISVPNDFQGTPRNLTLALYAELPPVGPPDVVLAQVESPEIGIDTDYNVELHPITASGDYHLYISLYMEGGGEWLPEAGIDYALTTEPITFDGASVDLGELELILAE